MQIATWVRVAHGCFAAFAIAAVLGPASSEAATGATSAPEPWQTIAQVGHSGARFSSESWWPQKEHRPPVSVLGSKVGAAIFTSRAQVELFAPDTDISLKTQLLLASRKVDFSKSALVDVFLITATSCCEIEMTNISVRSQFARLTMRQHVYCPSAPASPCTYTQADAVHHVLVTVPLTMIGLTKRIAVNVFPDRTTP